MDAVFARDLAALKQARDHGVVAPDDVYRLLLRAEALLAAIPEPEPLSIPPAPPPPVVGPPPTRAWSSMFR